MIVISPHLDDAIFSCGALLAEGDATVVTICAGIPPAGVPPHQFDVAAGFSTGAEAMESRRREDAAAGEVLGVATTHYSCLDVMYREGIDDRIRDAVAAALSVLEPGEVALGPLGLRHPDHVAVAEAFREIVEERELVAFVYEELPYAIAWPDYVPLAVRYTDCDPEPFEVSADVTAKRAAVNCYASQVGGDFALPALFLTERYHRLRGEGEL